MKNRKGEMTIEQLIKIILGIVVIIAVVVGVSLFFKERVIDFFKNETGEFILYFVK